MRKSFVVMLLPLCAVAASSQVEFRECPKCPNRIRVDMDAGKAYVNLSCLDGQAQETLAARAEKLLAWGEKERAIPVDRRLRPLMGWSSWNTFGVEISERLILETAQAMATNGLKSAGYTYVNIDDGFFAGHGEDGKLRFHPARFPNGMKPVVDGIHAFGLKAGTYSDGGADTCGSMGGDTGGIGAGLYGHDADDCRLHFNELGFDFIKVDFCGGRSLGLDERQRYTEIANAIKATGRTDVRFNICRWNFPGTWAAEIAESWRTTRDIRAYWKSVKDIIDENLYLSAYASPGHYNDMDMLEVGQLFGKVKTAFGRRQEVGLTADEETTHFGMWCMMSSPLLIGCDVRNIPESTKKLITNPFLLAVNQNDLGCQAYVVWREGDACILVKDADERFGSARYVALYNGSDEERVFDVKAELLDLGGRIDAFDLVEMADVGCFEDAVAVRVAPHASKFYRFDAERRLQRRIYEAETAFLQDYQELRDPVRAGTAFPAPADGASGGMVVRNLGARSSNSLIWRDVKIDEPREYDVTFDCISPDEREFFVSVDGGEPVKVVAPASGEISVAVKFRLTLSRGLHTIRLFNDSSLMPDVDCMSIY